jgi:hypothetical protein
VKHARKRLGERCGIFITELEYWELCGRIRMAWVPEHYARLLHSEGPDRDLYELKVQGQWVAAIWSPALARIVTFLAREEALAVRGLRREASA